MTTLSGYCDYNGTQCDKRYTLPWKVDFGNGAVSKVVIYGSGSVTFAGDLLANPPNELNLYEEHGALWAGTNPDLVFNQINSDLVWLQSAKYENLGDSARVTWFTCNTPKFCFTNVYTATFTKGEINGVSELFVNIDWSGLPPSFFDQGQFLTPPAFIYGTNGHGFSDVVSLTPTHPGSAFFHIPATFAETPEPATWAMMIMGFGGVGSLLRRRRTSAA